MKNKMQTSKDLMYDILIRSTRNGHNMERAKRAAKYRQISFQSELKELILRLHAYLR